MLNRIQTYLRTQEGFSILAVTGLCIALLLARGISELTPDPKPTQQQKEVWLRHSCSEIDGELYKRTPVARGVMLVEYICTPRGRVPDNEMLWFPWTKV